MQRVKITEVCDFQGGTQPPKNEWKSVKLDGYVRMLQIRDFTQRHKNNIEYVSEKTNLKTCKTDDILIGRYGASIGKICTGLGGVYNVALVKTIPDLKRVDRKFLYYILVGSSFQNFILNVGSRAAQAGFNKADLEKFQFPLPSLKTQQKIAAILDEADKLRQLDKKLIKKYEALSQSLFLETFGDPVRNDKGWDKFKMSEVCSKITDGTHHSPKAQNEGIPYVTAKHVKPFKLVFESKATYISKEDHDEIYKRCSPEKGDVLYIKDGATTGVACINSFDEPISLLSSLALLKLKTNLINNHYLCHWLNHNGIKANLISEFMSGAAIQRYTLSKINSFTISTPPISLQNQFAERVQEINKQKTQAKQAFQQSEELFNSLLQKAFKGELV